MQGLNNALTLFHSAAQSVRAYKDFLKKNRIDFGRISALKDFKKIPIMNKKEYILAHPLYDLFPKGIIPPMAYASSGSSGKPTFWFRGDAEESRGAAIHEVIFRDIFRIKKDEPTLVIVCFAMGMWIAGNYTVAACREMSRRGFAITTTSPGIEREDIINIFKDLAPKFKNVILAGYPSFLMDVAKELKKRRIAVNSSIKIITAGDKFSEEWRDTFLELMGVNERHTSLVSIYGCADAGALGYETPASIFIRRYALRNKDLSRALFGREYLPSDTLLPGLLQYDPEHVFFEEEEGELILTAPTAAPLIRYNIHDTGRIIAYAEMTALVKEFSLEKEMSKYGFQKHPLPFIVLKGRTDVAVTFYALNIFPENIRAGMDDPKISRFLSGNFWAYNKNVQRGKTEKLCINLELAKDVHLSPEDMKAIEKSVVKHLLRTNMEYRKLYATIGEEAAAPLINCIPWDSNFFEKNQSGVLSMSGKKPKVLLPS